MLNQKKINNFIQNDTEVQKIIHSNTFKIAATQKHHLYSTVAIHSLAVTKVSLVIAFIFVFLGIDVNIHELMIASICHDIGILGRFQNETFSSKYDCIMHHGIRGINKSEEILNRKLTDIEKNSMETHMFPLRPVPPKYLEGWIITFSDKLCAITFH